MKKVGTLGFVFPGQNSQQVGMLGALAQQFPLVEACFAEASAVLDYDLWHLVQNGTAEQLALTHITQPAILTASVAIWRVWLAAGGPEPALMAGHSLGEYSALVCADALAFDTAVALVRRRGELMQNAVPVGVGAMAAIIGLDDAAVITACEETAESELVVAANFNSPGQVVIAGHSAAVERAMVRCKTMGARRALRLSVSAPFHSPLMQSASEQFAEVIAQVTLRSPRIPVVQNADLSSSADPEIIRRNLVAQIHSPVPWVATVNTLIDRGITTLFEFGPDRVLCGLNRRIAPQAGTQSVNDPANLDVALQAAAALV